MRISHSCFLFLFLASGNAGAGDGKLIATAGTTSIEGTAGGGIVPWAVLSGYDSRDEISASVFTTRVSVDDYRFDAAGVAIGLYDRVELSVAQQNLELSSSPTRAEIQMNVFGIKYHLLGDLIYSDLPQISLGLQYKELHDGDIAGAVGASDNNNAIDYYATMSKVEIGAVGGYNLLWNVNLRATRANQLGLLGFGGDANDSYKLMLEGSLAVLFSRRLAVGIEYRQKPDNLGFAKEDDWSDVFIAWFPSKSFNITAAWANLGDVAGAKNQQGPYVSITGYLW